MAACKAVRRYEALHGSSQARFNMNRHSRGLYGRLVQQLGAEIGSGQIAPGERLDVERLEREHGVSRTVVREAVRVLATKGLVDARPKRGTYVLGVDRWNMLDPDVISWRYGTRKNAGFLASLNEVREIVEPAGARLAASRRTEQDLTELRAALTEMVDVTADVERAVAADVRFHHALIAAAHNEILVHLAVVMEAGLRARDLLVLETEWDMDLPDHAAVVDAVEAGNADEAETAMRKLLARASRAPSQ